MANVVEPGLCRFHWEITEPFLPFEKMEASFYHGSPDPTIWTVTFSPIRQRWTRWKFEFSLKCAQPGGELNTVLAQRLAVVLAFNGALVSMKHEEIYIFGIENEFRLKFDASAERYSQFYFEEEDRLEIHVEMHLPIRNLEVNPHEINYFSLCKLSKDLRRLRIRGDYSDLRLRSNGHYRPLPVHSYILRERWCNFFEEHRDELRDGGGDHSVRIGVSQCVLREILNHVYSGTGLLWGGVHLREDYINEVFKVIDRYKLHHLYTAFFKDDSLQERSTCRNYHMYTTLFTLNNENPPPWNLNLGTDNEFIFRIRFFVDAGAQLFSYTLQSRARERVHAHVSLGLLVCMNETRTLRNLHKEYFTIFPGQTVESGTCGFGLHYPIEDFLSGQNRSKHDRSTRHSIRCHLRLSDGTSAVHFKLMEREDSEDFYWKDDIHLFEVLSVHMCNLMRDSGSTDLMVTCPTGYSGTPFVKFPLHKAIFTARIRHWRSVIEESPAGDAIPDHVTCILHAEPFIQVSHWIYTGKLLPIQNHYLHEVENFASQGDLRSLLDLLREMSLPQQN